MKTSNLVLALTFFTVMCAKKENHRDHAIATFKESMALHDEVMPLMDNIYTLEVNLKRLEDSLRHDSVSNKSRIEVIRERLMSLRQASQHMMDWMHNIRDVPDAGGGMHHQDENHAKANLTDEEILKVQQAQKSQIEKVRDEMIKSIARAKEEINK